MLNAINFNQKISFKSNRENSVPVAQQSVARAPQDVFMQGVPKSTKNDKLQTASLLIGGAASFVFLAYLLKMMVPRKGQNKLEEVIRNAVVPDGVREKLIFEFEKMKSNFMDIDGSQNYIKNVLKLNWTKPEKHVYDINKARELLDKEHVGLDKVKEQVLSFLKLQNYNIKHNIENNGPLILCLDGPPGVGKTSIASSIAKAMEKPFERISLGGVSQKSFIKGSERLYKGAEPGQIIQSLQKAKVSDPVILLDEIDKMGRSIEHGDPAFALLDALEPKQCKIFTDDYLGVPYDLSNATFIITSNYMEKIPKVLRNRMSIININGYSKAEKSAICKLNVDKMFKNLQFDDSLVKFKDDAIEAIVDKTYDEGARNTIENTKEVFSKIVVALESQQKPEKIVVNREFVENVLKDKNKIVENCEEASEQISLADVLKTIFEPQGKI